MSTIRHIRNELHLTQAEFAKHVGRGQAVISHYETGKRRPDVETAKLIIAFARAKGLSYTMENIYSD